MGVTEAFAALEGPADMATSLRGSGVASCATSPCQQVRSSRRVAALPQIGCRVAHVVWYRAQSNPRFAGVLIRARVGALPVVSVQARKQLS